MTLHHLHDTQAALKKFHAILKPRGYLIVADLDKEDGSFHTDGTTDVHTGFARRELYQQVEDAGFEDIAFLTAYTIRKQVDGEEKAFPIFLMTARKI
jgi:ubiquinone/menaquinone biosynthesis C-methylase UbiE